VPLVSFLEKPVDQQGKPFREISAEEIKQECVLVGDLLSVIEIKPSLLTVTRLVAIMTLEKTLRHILYKEYKTITKIKFSVLIDKAKQKEYIDASIADQFRALKDFRNASAHHGLMNIHTEDILMPINEIVQQIHYLLDNYSLNDK